MDGGIAVGGVIVVVGGVAVGGVVVVSASAVFADIAHGDNQPRHEILKSYRMYVNALLFKDKAFSSCVSKTRVLISHTTEDVLK